MEFDKRLERAIERGQRARDVQGRELAARALSEEEYRNLHSRYRLELSDHIEKCLRKVVDHFPGFDLRTVVSEDGWGAKISRDDLHPGPTRQLAPHYSRLEMVIRPYSSAHIVELLAKGTVRNKEVLHRRHYQMLTEVDLEGFQELIDTWVVEYAERYAAKA